MGHCETESIIGLIMKRFVILYNQPDVPFPDHLQKQPRRARTGIPNGHT